MMMLVAVVSTVHQHPLSPGPLTREPIPVLLQIARHRVDALEIHGELIVELGHYAEHLAGVRSPLARVQARHIVKRRPAYPVRPQAVRRVLDHAVQVADKVPAAEE